VGAVELGGRETDSDGQRMEVGELAPDMVFFFYGMTASGSDALVPALNPYYY
jgi:hypothetical protein